jgi:uncharacterized membrane protein YfcA
MNRMLQLVGVGVFAGVISGLFGTGGGIIIVPLLILWLRFGEREATSTSLVAILIIATFGVILQGFYGNVDVTKAMLVGLPAVAGAVVGTSVQQRVPTRWLSLIFGCVLFAVAVVLVVEG